MPSPTMRDVHIDGPLTAMSVAYYIEESDFISDLVFPVVPVKKQSDRYFVYSKGDLLRDEAKPRTPGTESAGGTVGIDNTPSYVTQDVAFHEDVSRDLAANADAPLDPKRDAALNCTQKMMIRKERQFAGSFFKTGVWGKDWTGKSSGPGADEFLQFNQSTSHPLTVITQAKRYSKCQSTRMPNIMVVGPEVHDVIINHADILDRIKYTQTGVVDENLLAALFKVKRYIVGEAMYNTAKEKVAASLAGIYGKGILLAYAPDRPALRTPSAGYCISWTAIPGGTMGKMGMQVVDIPMDHLRADRIETQMSWDMKVVAADCGIFLDAAIG